MTFPGHFLLTHLLLVDLKISAPSRVVNVCALTYQLGDIDFDDVNLETVEYKAGMAYAQSKLALVLFTTKMARYLEGMSVQ